MVDSCELSLINKLASQAGMIKSRYDTDIQDIQDIDIGCLFLLFLNT